MKSKPQVPKGRRAVVVGGSRTPFVKAFAELMKLDTIALGAAAMRGLLDRHPIPRKEIDAVVWGGVILPSVWPNIGREIALEIGLDPAIEAMTVTRACASGLQAITTAAAMIERGDADVVIAGGSDSTSNAEVKLPQKLVHAMAPLVFGKRDARRHPGASSAADAAHRSAAALAEGGRADHRSADGRVGRADGPAKRDLARRAGRLRAALAPARGGRHRGWPSATRRLCRWL